MSTLTVTRGDNATYTLTITDSGGAVDITGYTIYFTVKRKTDARKDDNEALISKNVTSHTNAVGGITDVVLLNTDTEIDVGSHKFDFQMKSATDAITTLLTGTFRVVDDVTKRTN